MTHNHISATDGAQKTVSSAMLVRMAKHTRNVRSCRMRKESHIIKLEKSSRRGNFQIFIYWHSLKTFPLCLWTHRLTKFLVTFTHSGLSFRDNDFYWFSEYWFYCARGRIKIENFLFIFFMLLSSLSFCSSSTRLDTLCQSRAHQLASVWMWRKSQFMRKINVRASSHCLQSEKC